MSFRKRTNEIKLEDRIVVPKFYGNQVMAEVLKQKFDKNLVIDPDLVKKYTDRYFAKNKLPLIFDGHVAAYDKNTLYNYEIRDKGMILYDKEFVHIPYIDSLPIYNKLNDEFSNPILNTKGIITIGEAVLSSIENLTTQELSDSGFKSVDELIFKLRNTGNNDVKKNSVVSYYSISKFEENPNLKTLQGTFLGLEYMSKSA